MNTSVGQIANNQDSGITASSVGLVAAVLMVVVGMVWGIAMAISHDHVTAPAHAHLNLLGWVSLFLFGLFYRLHPAIDRSRLAMVQVVVWIVATVVMIVGVVLIHTGREGGEPFAAVGSLGALAGMLLFGWLVVRRSRVGEAATATHASLSPAE